MIHEVVDVVVLLGPPGSGKSTIGRELERRSYRWREWEVLLVERWGSRERFVAAKVEALPALHAEIAAWVREDGAAAVLETTGLSDAPLLDDLVATTNALVVRLDVDEEAAMRRVESRARDEHLTDDADANRRVWHAFDEHVRNARAVDLVIDTSVTSPRDAADLVVRRRSSRRSPRG